MRLDEAISFNRSFKVVPVKKKDVFMPSVEFKEYGVYDGDSLVGSYSLARVSMRDFYEGSDDPKKIPYLADLGVEKEYRGQGIGALMLDHFKEVIRKSRHKVGFLITDRGSKSYPLYKRNGFVEVGNSVYGGDSVVLEYRVK